MPQLSAQQALPGRRSPRAEPQTPGLFTIAIQSTPRLNAVGVFNAGSHAVLRTPSDAELGELEHRLRTRSVFARHSAERDLYAGKVRLLRGRSVLWLALPSGHGLVRDAIRDAADRCDRIAFLLAGYRLTRNDLHRRLAVSPHAWNTVDLLMDQKLVHTSTRSRLHRTEAPLVVDSKTQRLSAKLGVQRVFDDLLLGQSETIKRVDRALRWLEAARMEPDPDAALVKVAIGFETLLVYGDNEPLRKSMSERIAFLLGGTAEERANLAYCFGRFYDNRSAVVHGGRRAKQPSIRLEGAERLLMLASIAVAAHATANPSAESIRAWFETLRWSLDGKVPTVPFGRTEVRGALHHLQKLSAVGASPTTARRP